jgi:transcriptional repressor NrdR
MYISEVIMHCPTCNAPETKVIDSRLLQEGNQIRRRRKCESCLSRFTTYEAINIQIPYVVKNDGRRESFNPDKIIIGLKKACHKRGFTTDDLLNIIKAIKKELISKNIKEIPAKDIGAIVMEMLYNKDPVSYIRYGSFYWNYDDVDEFIAGLKNKKRPASLQVN